MFRIVSKDFFVEFLRLSRMWLPVSGIAVLISLGLFFGMTPNYGIDFKGGTDMIMVFAEGVTSDEVRSAAAEAGLPDANVQTFGSEKNQFLVQTASVSVVDPATIEKLKTAFSGLGETDRIVWNENQPDRMDVVFKTPVAQNLVTEAAVPLVGSVELSDGPRIEGGSSYVIRFEDLQARIEEGFKAAMGERFISIERLETVGPRVGEQLKESGLLSLLVALLLILIYIAFRFDIRYAPGAVAALAHDVIIAVGFFTAIQMEMNLPIIAALLTIVGYSLNDTIVVFDRIRENLTNEGDSDVPGVVNRSISETLSRTVITSLTTFLAVLAIFIWGSGLIQDFALALIVGIVVGTYSSVFVASPVMVFMDGYLKTRKASAARSESA